MAPNNNNYTPVLEENLWTLQDLPDTQVVLVEGSENKEEKLSFFYEKFSATLDLTAPENIIEKN
ncbi:hypothetical protein [Nibribacter koreensis]|uniref:Uncharacterized protein n=1 Tax=Nibribacter koreensis TaxID=1084519 RepID=A0ABP8F8S9_9BACT